MASGSPDLPRTNECIICLKKDSCLSTLREAGWATIIQVTAARKACLDAEYARTILFLEKTSFQENTLFYHRACYANYTSSERLKRLKSKASPRNDSNAGKQCSDRTLRSEAGPPVNKDLCIICQVGFILTCCKNCTVHRMLKLSLFHYQVDVKSEYLRNASTYNMNETLQSIACVDFKLKRRMTHAFDAMAGDIKYHINCLRAKERELEKCTDKANAAQTTSYRQLCFELHAAASSGQVSSIRNFTNTSVTLRAWNVI